MMIKVFTTENGKVCPTPEEPEEKREEEQ